LKAAQKRLNQADITLTANYYAEMEDQDFLDSTKEAYEKQQAWQEAMSVDARILHISPHKSGKPKKAASKHLISKKTP
jgi:molybdate-binding protein